MAIAPARGLMSEHFSIVCTLHGQLLVQLSDPSASLALAAVAADPAAV